MVRTGQGRRRITHAEANNARRGESFVSAISLEQAAPELRAQFLDGMSRAVFCVNVVTTDGPAGRAGVTVSAMSSISADGNSPTVLVCIHHHSKTAAPIVENAPCAINLLRDPQSS